MRYDYHEYLDSIYVFSLCFLHDVDNNNFENFQLLYYDILHHWYNDPDDVYLSHLYYHDSADLSHHDSGDNVHGLIVCTYPDYFLYIARRFFFVYLYYKIASEMLFVFGSLYNGNLTHALLFCLYKRIRLLLDIRFYIHCKCELWYHHA